MPVRKLINFSFKISPNDFKIIRSAIPNGELSVIARTLLLMYVSDIDNLKTRVAAYQIQQKMSGVKI